MGWSELLLIGVVALIVVGPKDLPVMFQSLGRMTAKVKRMAREFTRAMEDAADSSGVGDIAKDLNNVMNPRAMGVDKLREAADRFDKWDPTESVKGKKPERPLSPERKEAADKIRNATAEAATARKAAEAAEASAESAGERPAPAAESAPETAAESAPAPAPASAPAKGKTPAAAGTAEARKAAEHAAAEPKPPHDAGAS